MPSNIKEFEEGVFADNPLLKDIYWDAINTWPYLFYGDSISTITFGPNVKYICDYFMEGVEAGYEIRSSGNIEYIGVNAFEGSKWLSENIGNEVLYFDKCLYSCGNGLNTPTHIKIKEGTIGLTGEAFISNKYLTGVTIPESMAIIGGGSFKECASLTKVEWNAIECNIWPTPNSGYSVGFGNSLSDLTFGDNVKVLPEELFDGCTSLKSLSFPESLKTISKFTFRGDNGLETIKFNEQLDSIAEGAFDGCTQLKSLHLTARIIGAGAFASLENITDITISNNVKIIYENNFNGTKIAELTLPSTLERIVGLFTYGHIGKLTIECPNAEKVLDYPLGWYPTVINNMEFANGVKTCQNFSVVDTVTISESVVKMNGGEAGTLIYKAVAAEESGNIRCNYITIADGVKVIPNDLLNGSGITKVVLPSSVTDIGDAAFAWCAELLSVTAPWYDPQEVNTSESAFYGINEEATLYVPKGRIDAYKSLSPWSNFRYIKEIDGSTEIEEVGLPTIAYENGELRFTSSTPDAHYHYTISDPDIVTDQECDESVWLNAYYEISVYASAPGLINSGVAHAKLYFIEANLEEAGEIDALYKRGVLVSTSGDTLTISGLENNESIEVYDISGRLVGKGNANSGSCTLTIDSDQSIVLVRTATETIKVKR